MQIDDVLISGTAAHEIWITQGPSGNPNPVGAADTVQCSIDAADTWGYALDYNWSATAGSFVDTGNTVSTNAIPIWQAPTVAGQYTINVTVSSRSDPPVTVQTNFVVTVSGPPENRVVHLPNVAGLPGQIVTIPVLMDCLGNEASAQFSLAYDPSVLTYLDASTGRYTTGAQITQNVTETNDGHIGLSLSYPAGGNTFGIGSNHELVIVRFAISPRFAGATTIGFVDNPVQCLVLSTNAQTISATYTGGILTPPEVNHPPTILITTPPNGINLLRLLILP
jgi:hypothetical protein